MKKRILAAALIICALAIAIVGGTLAYFTDTSDAENVFTMGKLDITLDEALVEYNEADHTWIATGSDADRVMANEYENVYPGVVLPKDPTVHNEGDYDAYVRVHVRIENGMNTVDHAGKGASAIVGEMFGPIGSKWTLSDENAVDGNDLVFTFYYDEILKAGNDTSAVFEKVYISTAITQEDVEQNFKFTDDKGNEKSGFQVKITADAIQSDGFADATAAWAAFK